MAIGDKPNQNLFGTNYNPEDEEEKKARLAAQGAMIGSVETPSYLYRGATGMEDIAEMQGVAPGGVLDAEQGARGLLIGRQYNRGEPITIADMDYLMKQKQGLPALDSNMVAQVPGIENIRNPGAFNPTEPALKNALLGMLERADEREAQGLPRQAAPGIIDAPVETPSEGAQEQPGAVISPFLQSPNTPSGLGGPLLDGFNRVNDSFRAPNAPMGQDATRAALGGMTLNQYLNAPAGTEGVSGLQTDPQGRMITPSAQPPVDSAVPPATAQPPVDALSSFEQDSLARQQRIGGTGSFEGDSAAREARLRAEERQPGETQTQRDTRVAQSRTTGGQTQGLSFDDARRRARGQLAARGIDDASASMVNDLARGLQAGEPERLAKLQTAQAEKNRPEFEGKVYTINGVTFAQTSNGGAQVIDTGTETSEESTAKMKDFVFALEQIDKANDIFTAAEIQKDGFATNATEYFKDSITPSVSTPSVTDSGLTQQQEAGIQRVMADNEITREEAIKALKKSGQLK
jgi:hypothetical protein